MNLNKLKNLITNNKKFLTIALIVFLFLLLIFLVIYFYHATSVSRQKVEQLEQELQFLKALPAPDLLTEGDFAPGVVGEIEEGQEIPLPVDALPAMIFHSTGLIQEVHEDRIIVIGDGSTFADKQPRQLTLLFTLETSVVLADGRHFVGLAGLQYLQPNMHIFFDSLENIRGKTEFRSHGIKELGF